MTDLTVTAVDDTVAQLVRVHAERIEAEIDLLEVTLAAASCGRNRRLRPVVSFGRLLAREIEQRVGTEDEVSPDPLWCGSCGEFRTAGPAHRCEDTA